MTAPLRWSCRCGKTKLAVSPREGQRLVCYCRDCQAFPRVLGDDSVLDEAGGSDLFQTVPSAVSVLEGSQHLACLKLTDRGPLRWYAACCNSALANTIPTRQVPFVSVMVSGIDEKTRLGPVTARVFRKFATGDVPNDAGGSAKIVAGFLKRAAKERFSSRYKANPFFDEEGAPVARPRQITDAQRDVAYADTE